MFAGIFYNTIQAFYTNIETNLLIVKQKSGTFVKTAVPLFLYFRLTKALNWITLTHPIVEVIAMWQLKKNKMFPFIAVLWR